MRKNTRKSNDADAALLHNDSVFRATASMIKSDVFPLAGEIIDQILGNVELIMYMKEIDSKKRSFSALSTISVAFTNILLDNVLKDSKIDDIVLETEDNSEPVPTILDNCANNYKISHIQVLEKQGGEDGFSD